MIEFKVGDWVRIDGTLPNDVFCLTEKEIQNGEILLAHFSFSSDKWKLWKPKLGEWVVIKPLSVSYNNYFEIIQYDDSDPINCEPFIGTLPSFIKK